MGEVGYTFPNEQSEKSFRRIGWTELSRVPLLLKSVGMASSCAEATLSFSAFTTSFDERAERVWNEISTPIGVHRDVAYLNWRYSKPDQKYLKFWVSASSREIGFLVLKIYSNKNEKNMHLCEVSLSDGSPELLSEMLYFVECLALENEIKQLTAWCLPHHKYQRVYQAAGFQYKELHRFVFVTETLQGLWHMTQGDSDVY